MLHIKLRYSIEPKDRIYVKAYGFLSFAKNMGTHWSNKYSQKLFDAAKKSTADAIKTASKREIQKAAEATGDLTGNKIVDKITRVKTIHKTINQKQIMTSWRTYWKKDTYLQKKDNKLLMNWG